MGTLGGTNARNPTKPCNLVDPCYVLLGSAHVSPSSYALYITAIAVLIQVRYMLIALTSSPQYFSNGFLVYLCCLRIKIYRHSYTYNLQLLQITQVSSKSCFTKRYHLY